MATGKIQNFFDRLSTQVTIWQIVPWGWLVTSFALPAWATWFAGIMADYSPLSWVVAGFLGLLLGALVYWIWQAALRTRIRSQFDAQFIRSHGSIDPLQDTFVKQRIFINDFVLPSHPLVVGKTFIDCEIVGPANIYWNIGNRTEDVILPVIDCVYIDPTKRFANGFIFNHCLFRRCAFLRITLFMNPSDYEINKDVNSINWISLTPDSVRNPDLFGPMVPANQGALPAPQSPPSIESETPQKSPHD